MGTSRINYKNHNFKAILQLRFLKPRTENIIMECASNIQCQFFTYLLVRQ